MDPIVIVGGGLGGCVLAVHLARRGYAVDVFERYSEVPNERVTKRPPLNITLCERGLKALAAIGVRDRVLACAVPAPGRRIHGLDGSVAYQPYGNNGESIHSIRRSDLNDVLLDFASNEPGVRFHFNKKCVHLDLPRGIVHFEDTRTGKVSEVRGARIFGADGAYSAVRLQMQKSEHFSFSQQYWDKGYKALSIPARSGGTPALKGSGLHIWPRGQRMLIAFPNIDGSIMCSLLLPLHGEDSFESLTTEQALLSFFRSSFPDVVDQIPNLAEQFLSQEANSLLTIKCAPWSHADRALLIGDAAHAILPSYGHGANAAFEDCATLDRIMDEHGEDWTAVFQEFERRRRPNMDVMADLCIDHFTELFEHVADPRFLKRREIERSLGDLYPDLYRSLYSTITFSCLPYAEAVRVNKRQRLLVDQIVKLNDNGVELEDLRVRQILEHSTLDTSSPWVPPESGVNQPDPGRIYELAMGFWGAKAVLSAVELGVFAKLSRGRERGRTLAKALRLHPRGAIDFLDSLVSLGLLTRNDDLYENTPEVERFLVPSSPWYMGGFLELANSRLYPVWGKLTEALRSGLPQNEAKQEKDYYGNLGRDQDRLRTFLRAMTGLSMMASQGISQKFPWEKYHSFVDLGGAQGALSIQLAQAHQHLTGINFDLPAVEPYFREEVSRARVADRVHFHGGDFFAESLPQTDVIVMGHVLHNWSLAQKRTLIRKAYDALPRGGALIVYEALIDEARNENRLGLLMSLNMLLCTSNGFVFTGSECKSWMNEAGFQSTRTEHLHGSDSMVIGIK